MNSDVVHMILDRMLRIAVPDSEVHKQLRVVKNHITRQDEELLELREDITDVTTPGEDN